MAKAPQGVVPSDASVNLFYKIITNAYNEIFDKITSEDLTKDWRRKRILKQIEQIVGEANEDVKAWIKVEIPAFYEKGMFDTVKDIYDEAGDVNVDLAFAHFHREAIEAISRETYQEIASGMTGLTRTGERMVAIATRDSILKQVITGQITGDSAREIRKQIENTLRSEGITALTDRAGRRWDLKRYGEMLARTKLTQAHNTGVINRMAGGGYDLVMITAHGGSCPLCVPWQGEILSVSGISREYPSVDEARGAGLFHPNCRHAMTPYHADFLEDTMAWNNKSQEYVRFGDLPKEQQAEAMGMLDLKVYRGEGSDFQKKLRSTGAESMFGDGVYVSKDIEVAKQFGNVETLNIRLKSNEILTINNQKQYEQLVQNVIKKYPNEAINTAIPKYAKSLGYKAIQGSKAFDDLAGINILDESLLKKLERSIAFGNKKIAINDFEARLMDKRSLGILEEKSRKQMQAHFSINNTNIVLNSSKSAKRTAEELQKTFFHEFGHFVDYKYKDQGFLRHFDDYIKITDKEKSKIVLERIRGYGEATKKMTESQLSDLMLGMSVKTGEKQSLRLPTKHIRYLRQHDEIFADAYAQYRTNPKAFEKYAPNFTTYFKHLEKDL